MAFKKIQLKPRPTFIVNLDPEPVNPPVSTEDRLVKWSNPSSDPANTQHDKRLGHIYLIDQQHVSFKEPNRFCLVLHSMNLQVVSAMRWVILLNEDLSPQVNGKGAPLTTNLSIYRFGRFIGTAYGK